MRRWRVLSGCAALVLGLVAMSCGADGVDSGGQTVLPVTLLAIDTHTVLPGTSVVVTGEAFFADAEYQVTFLWADGEIALPIESRDGRRLTVGFPAGIVSSLPAAYLPGVLRVDGQLEDAVGRGELGVAFEVVHSLSPALHRLPTAMFPETAMRVGGTGFIGGGEGETLVEFEGRYTADEGGGPTALNNLGVGMTNLSGAREAADLVLPVAWLGIRPGRFEGRARAVNMGVSWREEGPWLDVVLDQLPPAIDALSVSAASRGQIIEVSGRGFVGAELGGGAYTAIRMFGTFQPQQGEPVELPVDGLEIDPSRLSAERLAFVMRVNYDHNCSSGDLGAVPGLLVGHLAPVIGYGGDVVRGPSLPLNFEVLPSRQVVWVRFLPGFTEALRDFGLRNHSTEVKARILEVVTRDYEGVNLEVRETQPDDFEDYSLVEVGGADPNGQELFGLDNTPGLDHCNARLDDDLAGRNADSQGLYGGVFVRSFLQLSPRIGDNPLAHPAFDEIFDPVMAAPSTAEDLPDGPRAAVVLRAIHTLGNLVGNTITHEIGHALGLPVAPGCGSYHNAPGERQIMDCGGDRPFHERAELVEMDRAVWTPENRRYLMEVLPLP